MTWILVAWLGYSCPGGWLSGLVPLPVRPLVCAPAIELERFDPAQGERARARVLEQGQTARIFRCDPRRCREIPVRWRAEATFEE